MANGDSNGDDKFTEDDAREWVGTLGRLFTGGGGYGAAGGGPARTQPPRQTRQPPGGASGAGWDGSAGPASTGGDGTCGPSQVALEIELGLRDQSGRITQKGQAEGVPTCPASVRQQGVRLYQQNQGGGAAGGAAPVSGPPEPPQGQPQAGPQGAPTAPQSASTELPASLDVGISSKMVQYAANLGKWLVSKLGQGGAQQFLSALAGVLGRRVNPETMPDMCFSELVDTLPEEHQKAVRLWQCGAEQPYGLSDEGQRLFFALQLATSSYDMQSGTTCGCVRG